ncbi:CAP domain-containing protein [Streptomyces tubbatahanensis]|uniref:CAP domain-containing protein n=1 Tax=Streptomyces tubbatahanensis TaxID=2923272 RepID=A0ABY3XY35_9ACTN|nr:CAP domain-containing protein [Streptomyces tubbatahanensis]UNS99249.1 CAP domain-containing protein [Streptomyces tubbatahanensis]
MGRHRRATPTPPAPKDDPARSATRQRHGRRPGRTGAPVQTGLLGASAALAMGAVAVASGLIPAPGSPDGPGDHRVRAQEEPEETGPPTTSGAPAEATATAAPGGDDRRTTAPGSRHSRKNEPSSSPSEASPSRPTSAPDGDEERGSRDGRDRDPARSGSAGGSTAAADQESAAEQEVLTLVNQERAKAGCRPVRADGDLAALAGGYSADMARRGFFSHTSPDGKSPWDRAEAAGVTDLGGENIARGQANARSVMDSWMSSPGHRANILNCDYRTLGVGAHFAEGGPWWTQDFGF